MTVLRPFSEENKNNNNNNNNKKKTPKTCLNKRRK